VGAAETVRVPAALLWAAAAVQSLAKALLGGLGFRAAMFGPCYVFQGLG